MAYLLQHLLIESARKDPNNEAVVFGKDRLSYGELEAVTNRLARTLIGAGVRRGDRVGIYINKSIPSVVSILGILKAGGVYVPLDPNTPPARLAYIIENCGIRCLLASTKLAPRIAEMFPQQNPLQAVVLTDDAAEAQLAVKSILWSSVLAHPDATLPENSTIETDLAYILYTSGSTGVPKGVMISHRTSLTFVNWVHDTFQATSRDRFSNHAPLHFDLSILDIFVALKAGAAIAPVPEGLSTFPVRLADWIEQNQITVWYSVPSILTMMVLHGRLDRHKFPKLRILFFAGEVFPVKFLRQLMELVPHPAYYNLYGPTETNVITYYEVPPLPEDRIQPIPIGKACANMEVFALTEEGKLVTQPGQAGELYARGSCVAQGYWGDPEKTNRSFIRNPAQSDYQETAYKTGDLVTLDDEGNYLLLGRRDHMVKSRGYRIELGEIDTALYSHPAVKEAAAVAIPDETITNRIKAFVVLKEPGAVTGEELQRYCAEKIPSYMVPESIEFRDTLPKTSTGKTDKPALAGQR